MVNTATHTIVLENGQITIPDSVRKALGIRDGDKIEVVLAENNRQEATIRRFSSVVESTYGLARKRQAPITTEDFDRIVEDEVVRKTLEELERSGSPR